MRNGKLRGSFCRGVPGGVPKFGASTGEYTEPPLGSGVDGLEKSRILTGASCSMLKYVPSLVLCYDILHVPLLHLCVS